tara:strand:- start:297 stop:863 length:567 start_codon:yes stop_codon:yes gene_type:complete
LKINTNIDDPYSSKYSKIKLEDKNGQRWFKLKLTNESKGTFLWAKSYELEEYFKQFGPENPDNYEMRNGFKPYKIPQSANAWGMRKYTKLSDEGTQHDYSYTSIFEQWNYESLYSYERSKTPNLSFLRAVGLSEGVQFRVDNIYTLPERTEFLELTTKILRNFFLDFLRPNTKKLILSYRSEDSDIIE